jgi:hypothetical protein
MKSFILAAFLVAGSTVSGKAGATSLDCSFYEGIELSVLASVRGAENAGLEKTYIGFGVTEDEALKAAKAACNADLSEPAICNTGKARFMAFTKFGPYMEGRLDALKRITGCKW